MKNRKFIRLLGALLFAASCSLAQGSLVEARLDSVKLKIGEQTNLQLKIHTQGKRKIQFPLIGDTINEHIDVVSQGGIDTSYSPDKSSMILSKNLLITSFDSGYFAIPPFQFIVDDDSAHPLETEPLLIQIQTVQVDTTKAIRDIKGPKDAPWNIREIFPYLIGALIALVLVLVLIWYIRKRKKNKVLPQQEVAIQIPPYLIALQELEKLKAEQLWQNGNYKLYQIKLSDIVRNYLEERFRINALEQTTEETMRSLRSINLPEELKMQLRGLLNLSDMVKFAKEQPLPAENEKSMEDAIGFVKTTANSFTFVQEKEAAL